MQPAIGHGGDRLSCQHASRERGSEAKDPLRSPCSVNGPINGYLCEVYISTLINEMIQSFIKSGLINCLNGSILIHMVKLILCFRVSSDVNFILINPVPVAIPFSLC